MRNPTASNPAGRSPGPGLWIRLLALLLLAPPLGAQSLLIPEGSDWLYSDTGPLTGTAWRAAAFDESAWESGPAPLGYGDGDEATVVDYGPSASSKYITTYFRRHFNVVEPGDYPELQVDVLRDDGAVVYLNGVEVFRTNLTSGSISASTLANGASGADESTKFYSQVIPGSLLVAGDNVIAVEIHQDSASSSDISFDLRLTAAPPALVPKGAAWRYLDNGVDPGAGWADAAFVDSAWLEGRGPLGYGDGDEKTVVGFVDTDPVTAGDQKNITTWFRRKFTVADPSGIEGLMLDLLRDDGAVVYLNGTEVARSNLPAGALLPTTPASGTATNAQESSAYVTATVSPSLLLAGENVLAVELHQDSPTSADISFDLRLYDLTPALSRGPYLNRCSSSEVTVRWRTNLPTNTVVRWGTVEGTLDQSFTDAALTTEHVVRLTGLAAETRYYYSIGRTVETYAAGPEIYFVTHPPAGSVRPFRCWVLGDSGTGNSTARAVRDSFTTWNGSAHTDLVLMLGDNAYNSGLDSEFQANLFDIYPQTLRNTVVWPTLGNHEAMNADSPTETGPYYNNFTMPVAGECGGIASGVRAYYSFDYANVHFICLDSQDTPRSTTGTMAQWLIADLDATNQEWIVAFWHHPPYTKGTHDSDSASDSSGRMIQMREQILPILESRGVDLVLNGHSHTYERTKFLNGHYGFSGTFSDAAHVVQPGDGDPAGNGAYIKVTGPNAGAVYTVTGSAGQAGNSFGLGHPAMVKALAQAGSLAVDVNGKQMEVKFIHSSGEVRDTFRVVHQVPPVAQNSPATVTEDTPGAVPLSATDENGDTLSAVIVTPPAHGTLSGAFPALTYTPEPDWHGSDSFTWKANDSRADSNVATVTLTVTPAPDAPVAIAATVLTAPETPVLITLTGADVDGDALSFAVATPPASGALSGTPPSLTFTPEAGFAGTVTFTFTASDGALISAPATVTINVDSVPVVGPRTITTDEDTAAAPITLTGTDAEGHALTFSIFTAPAHGMITGTLPELIYTPAADYHGADSLTYRAHDGFGYSAPATVSVTVVPVNDRPVALPQTIASGPPLAIQLSGTDVDGDALTYAVVTLPPAGSLSGTAPALTYAPEPGFLGTVEFTFKVNDGTLDSAPATVTLTVENAPPSAPARTLETNEDAAAPPLTLTATDANEHPVTFAIVTPPVHGTLSGTLPEVIYTPVPDYHGADAFTYKANDGLADSAPATVSVTILPVNDPPIPLPPAPETPEDTDASVTLAANDVDGDTLVFAVSTPPAHGTFSGTPPELTYTPDANWHGTDTFEFTVSDGLVTTAPQRVTITVTPVNDAPITSFDVFSVSEDQALSVTLTRHILRNDSDLHDGAPGENNTPLTAVPVIAPQHAASFTLNANGTFTYTPRPDFHGLDGFTYRAVDALGAQSEPETVLIAVWAVNDAPVAASQSLRTLEDVPIPVRLRSADADLLITSDPNAWLGIPPPNNGPAPHDADPIYTIGTPPQHGTLIGTAPNLIYTPDADFHGTDSFTFTASDGLAVSNVATVTITIDPDSDGDALPDGWEISAFAALTFDGNDDPDGDGQDNAFELIAGNAPADANSCLCMEPASPSPTGGAFRLNRVQPGVRYRLQSSANLYTWDTVTETTYEIEGPGALYDPRTSPPWRRFYRVTVAND